MIFARNHLLLFQMQLCLIGWLSTTVFETSRNNGATQNCSPVKVAKGSEKVFKLKLYLGFIYCIVLCLQMLVSGLRNEMSASNLFTSLLYAAAVPVHLLMAYNHFQSRHQITGLNNALMDFEMKHNPKRCVPIEGNTGTGGRMQMLLMMGIFTYPVIVICSWLLMFFAPCFPGNFGYKFLNECDETILDQYIWKQGVFKLAITSFSIYIFLFSLGAMVIEVTLFTAFHCYCLQNYLWLMLRKLETEFNRGSSSGVRKVMRMYKEIEIMVICYNEIHSGALSLGNVWLICLLFVLSFYGLTGLYSKLILPLIFICAVVAIDMIVMIFEVDGGLKCGVHKVSKAVITKAKVKTCGGKTKGLRHHLKSWRVLRIYLSSVNFYDEHTPLTIMGFNIDQTINLLMLK